MAFSQFRKCYGRALREQDRELISRPRRHSSTAGAGFGTNYKPLGIRPKSLLGQLNNPVLVETFSTTLPALAVTRTSNEATLPGIPGSEMVVAVALASRLA